MNPNLHLLRTVGILFLGSVALAGCGTPPARNFGGPWRPANAFPEQPAEIPLRVAYTFYAAPTDGTLKTMLARWARDTRQDLAYRSAIDVTLYAPVADLRTTDLDTAVAELNRLYATQNILVTVTGHVIAVDGTGRAAAHARAEKPVTAQASTQGGQAWPHPGR